MQVLSSLSGITFYAPSAGFAPTNSAEVSAIASSYQVVSATATQLNAGTAYLTSVNDTPISASRAGNAVNATQATSAWYDGTGRLISALPDSAAVSAIASSYAESAASSKQDTLTFGYDTSDKISSINGSSLAGEGGGLVTSIQTAQDPWYQQSISGINGSSIYPKWAVSANSAGTADTAGFATFAQSAGAAPTSWASSFISSVSSPSGTIRVMNGNEIEGTNSAVLPSTVVEGFSVISSIPQSLTAFSFTVPTSNPDTQVVITGGWVNGNFGISGDNGVTAESSLAGPVNVTFDMPGATAFDVTSEAWVSDIGYTASALDSEIGGGIGELAWASALPTYQYNAEDKISSINGSALAGGGGGGEADWSAESGQPGYIENKPVPKTLMAGQGITITENSTELVVASTNTLYTAGSGLTLNGTTFAVDTATVQGKITYGYDASGNISGIDGSSLAGSDPEAADLYVQAPLYTGVSGGSAYIGWSGYNETVLWSSTTTASSFTLSESISSFERLKVRGSFNAIDYWTDGDISDSTLFTFANMIYAQRSADGARLQQVGAAYTSTDGLTFTCRDGHNLYWTNTANSVAGGATAAYPGLYKVIGVNRTAGE